MNDKPIQVNVSLDRPDELINFAQTLKKIIVEQKLFTNIQGKNYPHVEAWQFLGGSIGVLPVVTELTDLSTENVIKYRATVELRRLNGDIVGSGIAICTNKERGKTGFDEYAVASMAQTRAVGKAFRLAFGFLMKLAGYQALPIEEVIETEGNYNASEEKKDEIVASYNS